MPTWPTEEKLLLDWSEMRNLITKGWPYILDPEWASMLLHFLHWLRIWEFWKPSYPKMKDVPQKFLGALGFLENVFSWCKECANCCKKDAIESEIKMGIKMKYVVYVAGSLSPLYSWWMKSIYNCFQDLLQKLLLFYSDIKTLERNTFWILFG